MRGGIASMDVNDMVDNVMWRISLKLRVSKETGTERGSTRCGDSYRICKT